MLPKEASADYIADSTSSLTTDGSYLYIYWCSGKGMFKIGTGEGNTLAGKVYLHVTGTQSNENVSWVFLNNKLYARKADESLGVLNIINPDTFAIESSVSLHCDDKDLLNNAQTARFNKRYPLLTNGKYLYIILMKVVSVERKLKEESKDKIEEIKKEEENAKKETENNKGDQAPKSKEKNKKKAPKKSIYGYEDSSNQLNQNNPYSSSDPNANIVNPAGELLSKTIDSIKDARICEFYCIEFDTDYEKYQKMDKTQFKSIPEVMELYESFSSFFTYEE